MHLLHYQPVPSTLPHGQKTRGFCQCFVLNLSYVPTTMHDVFFRFHFSFSPQLQHISSNNHPHFLFVPCLLQIAASSSDSEILGVLGSDTSDTVTYRDAPTILLRFPLPECTPFRFHEYLEKTADVFYRLIFDYHQEKKACEDHGTQWQPDDALHETVYQTQLLTMAFLDGHYRTPALVIETVNNLQRRAVVQLAIQNLKDLYPFMVKENLEQIFVWLFYKHAPILRHTGQPLDFIVQRLNISADTASSLSSPHGESQ